MKQLFIVGPTASGKSALALALAQRIKAEIYSVDAFQVYRQLDIGTGKATGEEQSLVPHRLIDLRNPLDDFSVADYLSETAKLLHAVDVKIPQIWVGGTGLYMRALRQGLSKAPESNSEIVRQLNTLPLQQLQEEIKKLDPVWCQTADLQNSRRIIRALAVVRETGRPLSEWQKERSEPLIKNAKGVLLLPERELNRNLIAQRVKAMWDAGWPDEVSGLLRIEGWSESQSAKALGYLTIADYLRDKLSKDGCLEKIIIQTGQYAKRQETWFKSEPDLMVMKSHEESLELALRLL